MTHLELAKKIKGSDILLRDSDKNNIIHSFARYFLAVGNKEMYEICEKSYFWTLAKKDKCLESLESVKVYNAIKNISQSSNEDEAENNILFAALHTDYSYTYMAAINEIPYLTSQEFFKGNVFNGLTSPVLVIKALEIISILKPNILNSILTKPFDHDGIDVLLDEKITLLEYIFMTWSIDDINRLCNIEGMEDLLKYINLNLFTTEQLKRLSCKINDDSFSSQKIKTPKN